MKLKITALLKELLRLLSWTLNFSVAEPEVPSDIALSLSPNAPSYPVNVLPDATRVIVPAFAAVVMPSLSRLLNVLFVTVAVIDGEPPVTVSSFSPSSPLRSAACWP